MKGSVKLTGRYMPKCVKSKHKDPLPASIRLIATGPSECGKTNVCIELIRDHVSWQKVYIITRKADQPLYNNLITDINKTRGVNVEVVEPKNVTKEWIDDRKGEDCIYILDDIMTEKNQHVYVYLFSTCRHDGQSVFYCTQKYTEIPTALRANANIVIMFRCGNLSKQYVHRDTCDSIIELKDFQKMQLKNKHDYIVIFNNDHIYDSGWNQLI